MKTRLYLLFGLMISIFCVSAGNIQAQNQEENWEEVYRENNVVFSVLHNASRITKTVNSVIRVENLNDYKVFVQFTPSFYCNGGQEDEQPILQEEETTYLAAVEGKSLHSFQVCTVGQAPLIKIENLQIHQTDDLDAVKRIKN